MTDKVAALHDDDSSPSSEKLITTEELPATVPRNKLIATPQITHDDPLSQESAEALVFDATEAVAMSCPPLENILIDSDPARSARSLLNMPPAPTPTTATSTAATTAQHLPLLDVIEYPRPTDVLMPVEGYQLWAGNSRYLKLVAARQPEFLQAAGRSEQARIALEIVHAILQDGGRFLTAVDVMPTDTLPTNSSIVRATAWELMKETDVLVQLGKALRSTEDEERKREKKEKKRRRKEKKRKRKERRRARRRERALMVPASDEEQISPSSMGALQSLYYVPSYYPVAEDHSKNSLDYESDSVSSSSSSSLSEVPPAPPVAKKRRAVRKTTPVVKAPAPAPAPKQPAPLPAVAPVEKIKEISFHYKPKPMKSKKAALDNEGEASLPKGVTVRPSGKWQAQTYFAGQSRYVGVYDTSRLASRAYIIVQDYLRQYRSDKTLTKDSPKEALAVIFANARRAADDAVRELKDSMKTDEVAVQVAKPAPTKPAPAPTTIAAPTPSAKVPLPSVDHPAPSPSQPTNLTNV